LKRILLVGSGHSHLEVLKSLHEEDMQGNEFTLISPCRETYYSGLLPRYLMGKIPIEKIQIPSFQYAESKGVKTIQDKIVQFDSLKKRAVFDSGRELEYDILSLDIGGVPQEIQIENPQDVLSIKPFPQFIQKWQETEKLFRLNSKIKLVVVGGGPAAVEVASALRLNLNRNASSDSEVHLVTRGQNLCSQYPSEISFKIQKSLEKLGVKIHFGEEVKRIDSGFLKLQNNQSIAYDKVFLALPSRRPNLTQKSIGNNLLLCPNVFAVGDCAKMDGFPDLPRSGVTAVKQGRHLAINLKLLLQNKDLLEFNASFTQLNILLSGWDLGRIVWGRFSLESKFSLKLKNHIDDKYMASFGSSSRA
jgi:NADH dehydrogenase FAD-containing subunit